MAQNLIFTFSTSSLKQLPAGGASYYAKRLPNHYSLFREFLDIAHTNSSWECVNSDSDADATYINLSGEIIAKNNLNLVNLMQTFKTLLLQNYSTEFWNIEP